MFLVTTIQFENLWNYQIILSVHCIYREIEKKNGLKNYIFDIYNYSVDKTPYGGFA